VKPIKTKPCVQCGDLVQSKYRERYSNYYHPKRCSKCQKTFYDPVRAHQNLSKATAGENNPRWRLEGAIQFATSGSTTYRKIKHKGKWLWEHRHVMEQFLERKLATHELVHHINECGLDNRIENLTLVTPKEHSHIHVGRGSRWSRHFDCCTVCKGTHAIHSSKGVCNNCYQTRWRREHTKTKDAPPA